MKAMLMERVTMTQDFEAYASRQVPGMVDVHPLAINTESYELGRRNGALCGLLIGSISGAIMVLVVIMML